MNIYMYESIHDLFNHIKLVSRLTLKPSKCILIITCLWMTRSRIPLEHGCILICQAGKTITNAGKYLGIWIGPKQQKCNGRKPGRSSSTGVVKLLVLVLRQALLLGCTIGTPFRCWVIFLKSCNLLRPYSTRKGIVCIRFCICLRTQWAKVNFCLCPCWAVLL